MSDARHYFSRIRLKSETPDLMTLARLATKDHYQEHRLVWSFFPDEPEAKRDFIYRREAKALSTEENDLARLTYYMVSRRPPQPNSAIWEVETRDYAPQLVVGDCLEFSLRANPVSRSKKPRTEAGEAEYRKRREASGKAMPRDSRRRKRDDLMKMTVQHLQETFGPTWKEHYDRVELANEAGRCWLETQGQRLGFDIEDASVASYSYDSFTPRKGETVEIGRMDFTGNLRVAQPEAFSKALFEGIGPAKAFGCGLLLVRRF